MNTIRSFPILAALLFLSSGIVFAQQKNDCATTAYGCYGQPRPMTLAIAKQIVAAAYKAACSPPVKCTGSLVVTDDAGMIVYLETLDGTITDVPELTIKKAKTAAIWRRPTQTFQDAVKKGTNIAYADGTFSDMTLSPGGVPLFVNGRCVGGFAHGGVGMEGSMSKMEGAAQEAAVKFIGSK